MLIACSVALIALQVGRAIVTSRNSKATPRR
jgi:hypothetical protein